MELLNDPVLKTTSNNYNFKYVSSEDFERVIKTVQRDRVKANQDTIWDDFCRLRLPATGSDQPKPKPKTPLHGILKNVNSMKVISRENTSRPSPETPKNDKNTENTTKQCPTVRVLTDEEIKNIIDSAFKEVIDKSPTRQQKIVHSEIESLNAKKNIKKSDSDDSDEKSNSDKNENKPNGKDKKVKKHSNAPVLLQDIDVKSYCSTITISSNHSDKSNEKNGNDNDSDFDIEDNHNIALSEIEKDQIRKIFGTDNEPNYTRVHYKNDDAELKVNSNLKLKNQFKNKIDSDFDIDDDEDESDEDDNVEDFNYNTDYVKQDSTTANNIYPVVRIKAPYPISNTKANLGEDDDEDDYDEHDEKYNVSRVVSKVVHKQPAILEESSNTIGSGDNGENIKIDFNNIEKSRDLFGVNSNQDTNFLQCIRSIEQDDTILLQNLREQQTERNIYKKENFKKIITNNKHPEQKIEYKQEVIGLLSKITSFQKKILSVLDEIKLNLLDIPEPDGACDTKRRQKRSTEFTTRFARNYLYQIGRLTEDIRIFLPKEAKQFKINQDISNKICALYNVILQAAQSYNKNMINFIIDRNPDKLQVFLNLIINSTKLCCEKHIFDINDLIVKTILEKCCDIIIFSQNINSSNGGGINNYRIEFNKNKTSKKMKHYPKKWDPSSVKNKLSMYDTVCAVRPAKPTSSLKRLKQKPKTKSKLVINIKENNATSSSINNNAELLLTNNSDASYSNLEQFEEKKGTESKKMNTKCPETHRLGDNINTMMENVQEDDTLSINSTNVKPIKTLHHLVQNARNKKNSASVTNAGADQQQANLSTSNMNDTVLEALQSITKQQVQEILGPLMSNLGLLLSDKSPVNVQTILNGLNKKNINTAMPKSPLALTSNDLLPQSTIFINNHNNNNSNKHCDIDDSLTNINVNDDKHNNIDNNIGTIDKQKEQEKEVDNNAVKRNKSITAVNIHKDNEKSFDIQEFQEANKKIIDSTTNQPIDLKTNKTFDETIVFHSKNIQYTFIKSKINDDNQVDDLRTDAKKLSDEINQYKNNIDCGDQKLKVNDVAGCSNKKKSNKIKEKMKNSILKERTKFIQQIANNSLYVNDNFTSPWKVVSRIADQIADDILLELDNEIDFDEKNFILDFLINELS